MLFAKIKNKIKRKIRETGLDLNYLLFGQIPASVKKITGLRILVYHGVCRQNPFQFNSRFLSEKQFEEHLLAIKKCFNPISFEEYKNGQLSSSRLNVLLTFDDGLKNNFTNALPLLIKHKVPAIFFISTLPDRCAYLLNDILDVFSMIGPKIVSFNGIDFTKKKKEIQCRYMRDNTVLANYFHDLNAEGRDNLIQQVYRYVPAEKFDKYTEYLALMNNRELFELSKIAGMTLGSHGSFHTDFSKISVGELNRELVESKKSIESITGKECDLIAFPYGNYEYDTLNLCKKNGYRYLFGTEKINALEDLSSVIPRFTVNPYVSSINQMYYIAKNNYE